MESHDLKSLEESPTAWPVLLEEELPSWQASPSHPAFRPVHDVATALRHWELYGVVLLAGSVVDIAGADLALLAATARHYMPSYSNRREEDRWSLNSSAHVMNLAYVNVIDRCLGGLVGEAVHAIAGIADAHRRVYIDAVGGDFVAGGGEGQDWHSDDYYWYKSGFNEPVGTIAASVFVADQLFERAPIKLVPWSVLPMPGSMSSAWNPQVQKQLAKFDNMRVLGRRGDVLLRDVSLWHAGTSNSTPEARPLPGFRFMFRGRASDMEYRPARSIPDKFFALFHTSHAVCWHYHWRGNQ